MKIFETKKIELTEEFTNALEVMENTRDHVFVTGKAGTGKSTLLYQTTALNKGCSDSFITLFYDAHYIDSSGSLRKRLADDFLCEENKLEVLFNKFDKILSKNYSLIIIMEIIYMKIYMRENLYEMSYYRWCCRGGNDCSAIEKK